MSFAAGACLGPYQITAHIGAGGMGEVYSATDTNLKRAVALKVLPALVATDGGRLIRFQREAEVLASLNHPNIAAIYGLERSGETTALVMELVEGPTLADRIAQGAIPLEVRNRAGGGTARSCFISRGRRSWPCRSACGLRSRLERRLRSSMRPFCLPTTPTAIAGRWRQTASASSCWQTPGRTRHHPSTWS
jgi:hypothetical protein